MTLTTTPLTLCAFILLLSATFVHVHAKPYAAANCLSQGADCKYHTSQQSEVCAAKTAPEAQPEACVTEGCEYCLRVAHHRNNFPCDNDILSNLCGYDKLPTPSPSPSFMPSVVRPFGAAKCLSQGDACTWWARRSGVCMEKTAPETQDEACVTAGCKYCTEFPLRQNKIPCDNDILATLCGYGEGGDTPTTSPMSSSSATVSASVSSASTITPSASPSSMSSVTASASFDALPSVSAAPVVVQPYAAARCLSQDDVCTWYARRSGVCTMKTAADMQPEACVTAGCRYCTRRQMQFPCNNEILSGLCGYGEGKPTTMTMTVIPTPSVSATPLETQLAPSMTPSISASASLSASPTPTNAPPSKPVYTEACTWEASTASGDIVIDLSRVPAKDGWEPTYRSGYHGLVYRPRRKGRGIDKKGEKGVMCFDIRPKVSGNYYVTALSYAPHNTEHNDVWMSSSKGFELWQAGVKRNNVGANKYKKAYQNFGDKGIAQFLKTVDFDGHRFLVPDVVEDEVFNVCLSGRSYQFEMFRLILVKCEGVFCTGRAVKNNYNRPVSTCVSNGDDSVADASDEVAA